MAIASLVLSVLIVVAEVAPAAATAERPNIILIFADDLGWKDVGYHGADYIETPHIDRLATEGMVFTDAYAAAGNCAPSRACLLSGTYTPRHHVYAVGNTNRGAKNLQRMIPVPNKSGLAKSNVTMAEALKATGYATGHFGKWHLAGKDGAKPSEQGFDETYDSFGEGKLKEGSEGNKKGPPEDAKGVYTLTRKACEFMEAHREGPFFVYLAHHAIHTPLQGRIDVQEKFQIREPGEYLKSHMYAACTYDLDDSVGVLLARLKELGLEENTLVVFTSDNGATPQSPQEPLRGNKGGYYEGGIREPFIVRWPGKVQPGSKCDVPVINVDLYPTFLAAAGVDAPEDKTLDGESLLPLLTGGGALERKSIFWHFPGYLDRPVIRGRDPVFRTRPVSVIRQGDWKLHLYHEEWQLDGGREKLDTNNAVELYNLAEDIGERHNVASVHTDQRDQLLNDLLTWFDHADAPLPTEPNPAYDPDAKTGGKKRGKRKQAEKN